MIYFDVTKAGASAHASGLVRVSRRLQEELGSRVQPVRWPDWDRRLGPGDWFLTPELFAPEERPGIGSLTAHGGRIAAIYHDSIPLKFPHITWPHSVARHPAYLKWLALTDQVFAVSAASREELAGIWRWQRARREPPVEELRLGADFRAGPRGVTPQPAAPRLLCVGILEPRKNQALLLEAAARLWREGLSFELDLVGRINPHFGRPIRERMRSLQRQYPALHYHGAVSDARLDELYSGAWATLFPTRAEGCGLPLLESLWRGVPCVCSDLPVLRENADAGGCLTVPVDDLPAWVDALRRLLAEPGLARSLRTAAQARPLPTWRKSAGQILATLAQRPR